jgi:hypothetical protein
MAKTPARYYILEANDLTKLGKVGGMTKEEAEKEIARMRDALLQFPYVIIKGVEIKPKFRL